MQNSGFLHQKYSALEIAGMTQIKLSVENFSYGAFSGLEEKMFLFGFTSKSLLKISEISKIWASKPTLTQELTL